MMLHIAHDSCTSVVYFDRSDGSTPHSVRRLAHPTKILSIWSLYSYLFVNAGELDIRRKISVSNFMLYQKGLERLNNYILYQTFYKEEWEPPGFVPSAKGERDIV